MVQSPSMPAAASTQICRLSVLPILKLLTCGAEAFWVVVSQIVAWVNSNLLGVLVVVEVVGAVVGVFVDVLVVVVVVVVLVVVDVGVDGVVGELVVADVVVDEVVGVLVAVGVTVKVAPVVTGLELGTMNFWSKTIVLLPGANVALKFPPS
jgi:hypothetical protein